MLLVTNSLSIADICIARSVVLAARNSARKRIAAWQNQVHTLCCVPVAARRVPTQPCFPALLLLAQHISLGMSSKRFLPLGVSKKRGVDIDFHLTFIPAAFLATFEIE